MQFSHNFMNDIFWMSLNTGRLHLCLGLETVGIFRVGSSKKRVRQVLSGYKKTSACLFICIYYSVSYNSVALIVTIFCPASWGVWPGMGRTLWWGEQCPWCSCTAERVPQRLAWPTADERTLHSLHQHNVWGVKAFCINTHKNNSPHSLAVIGINYWGNIYFIYMKLTLSRGLLFLQCWIIQTKPAPSSSWYFCSLRATATHCSAFSACCLLWPNMLETNWTMTDKR